jgi:MoxR-like ATPase
MKVEDVLTLDEARTAAAAIERLRDALKGVLFGQEGLIEGVVVGILARGHLLIESLPGLGKTMLVKGLARALGLDAQRIQFTPDLLPGDITGNPILQEVDGERRFVFQPGPLFAHVVLADEINRASPKTQSALLEAMQEGHVTVFGERHPLPNPFFVLATQNPIELEGTYPLPEAQLDRFLMKLGVPRNAVPVLERIVKEREIGVEAEVERVFRPEELTALLDQVRRVFIPDVVAGYIARLVDATHPGPHKATELVLYGASPRAAIALAAVARARALMAGRQNASFEDVGAFASAVLAHRLVLNYRARLAGRTAATIVSELLDAVTPLERELPPTFAAPAAPPV